jgi:hypothetical protein
MESIHQKKIWQGKMSIFFYHPTRQTVPLSDLAVDIIKEALEEAGEEAALVFPSKSDAALEVEAGTLCIGGNSMAALPAL